MCFGIMISLNWLFKQYLPFDSPNVMKGFALFLKDCFLRIVS